MEMSLYDCLAIITRFLDAALQEFLRRLNNISPCFPLVILHPLRMIHLVESSLDGLHVLVK